MKDLFINFQLRRTQQAEVRAAHRIWQNRCQWDGLTRDQERMVWLAPLHAVQNPEDLDDYRLGLRFEHPSMHARLERYTLVNHWVDKINHNVVHMHKDDHTLLARWSHLEHEPFWRKLLPLLEDPQQRWMPREGMLWTHILFHAAPVGNLVPFACAQRKEWDHFLAVLHENQEQGIYEAVHPSVGLWLVNKGVCSLGDIGAFATKDKWGMDNVANSFWARLFGYLQDPVFVAQTCETMLRDYGLSTEEKMAFVGSTMLVFGHAAWSQHLVARCGPHVKGIDMQVVQSISTVEHNTVKARYGSLEDALRLASGALALGETPNIGSTHPNLAMLLDLHPPKNRVDLYHLGVQAKKMDSGTIEVGEQFELP